MPPHPPPYLYTASTVRQLTHREQSKEVAAYALYHSGRNQRDGAGMTSPPPRRPAAGYHSVQRRPGRWTGGGYGDPPRARPAPGQHPQTATARESARAHRYGAHYAEVMARTPRCRAPPPPSPSPPQHPRIGRHGPVGQRFEARSP